MNINELILLYAPDGLYAAKVRTVVAALGMTLRTVERGEVTQTAGYLAGMPGQAATPKPPIPPSLAQPMMVLVGLSRARMDALFAALREGGAPPCDRKAILTPTNMGWSLAALYEELGREHAEMHKERR